MDYRSRLGLLGNSFSASESSCGTCHMASLSTLLPRTATPTISSETILQTCQHQLMQALATSTAHRNIITSLQIGPLSCNFLRFSCLCWSSSHNLRLITKPLLNKSPQTKRPQLLPCMKTALKISQHFYCRNKLLGSNSTSKGQRTS